MDTNDAGRAMGETVRIRLPDYVITQELDMRRHLTLLQYIMEGGRHISQCRPPVFSSKEDD